MFGKIRITTIRPYDRTNLLTFRRMLKRSPSLTDQAKAHIKELILNGKFKDGRIPSESDLANELGVSRTTIRDALSRLEIEGTVFRKQGAGTFVNRPGLQIKSRLDEIWSYEAVLEAHGYVPAVQVLEVRQEVPAETLRTTLAMEPGEKVTVLEKLFTESSEPVIFTENHIPCRFIPEEVDEELLTIPIYELMEDCCGQHLNYYLSEVVPMVADEELARLLNVEINTPLLALEETGYNDDNEPILWAHSFFRDDLVRFRMIRRAT
ncbi:MAG: GntR family transcriptional regulator [Candidatus Promineifilaceae bacterium]